MIRVATNSSLHRVKIKGICLIFTKYSLQKSIANWIAMEHKSLWQPQLPRPNVRSEPKYIVHIPIAKYVSRYLPPSSCSCGTRPDRRGSAAWPLPSSGEPAATGQVSTRQVSTRECWLKVSTVEVSTGECWLGSVDLAGVDWVGVDWEVLTRKVLTWQVSTRQVSTWHVSTEHESTGECWLGRSPKQINEDFF